MTNTKKTKQNPLNQHTGSSYDCTETKAIYTGPAPVCTMSSNMYNTIYYGFKLSVFMGFRSG